jgi:hypothetical protein
MKHAAWIINALALLASIGWVHAQAPSNTRKLYKWVDQQGLVHYGDSVPPEYAAQEQDIINAEGVAIAHVDAQKTAEQLAAEDKKKADAEAQRHRDQNLLNTYVSVQEIERLRDQRLALLADQMRVTNQFIDMANGRLKKAESALLRFKPYSDDPRAPPVPDQVAEDLVHAGTELRTQELNLHEKQTEESTMRAQFATDLSRFKELKGIH